MVSTFSDNEISGFQRALKGACEWLLVWLYLPWGPGPCLYEPRPQVEAEQTPDSTDRLCYCKSYTVGEV